MTSVSVKPERGLQRQHRARRARDRTARRSTPRTAPSRRRCVMPQTMHTATSAHAGPPNRQPIVAAQLPLIAIATIVSVVRPSRSARKPAPTQPMRARRDRRERRELGRGRRDRRRAASARSSRSGTRRSTPTSRRAPTCGRGSRGWRAAAARRATRSATSRGSKRGAGARFGPTPASADQQRGDERAQPTPTASGTRQSMPPSALNRCGNAEPSVSAPTRMPTMQPHVAACAHVDGELHADRIDAGHADAGHEAQQRRDGRASGSTTSSNALATAPTARRRGEEPARIDAVGEAEDRADEAADDEADLHAARQRRLREARQPVFRDQRGNDGRRREPQRHRRDLADRDDRDRRALGRPHGMRRSRQVSTAGVRSSAA